MGTLLLIVLVSLAVSFLCSILEAALLSVRTTELTERARKGDRAAALMLRQKTEGLDDAISAILILNTLAHTIGAAMAGAQAAHVFGDAYVGVFSGVLTLLVLVVTEIIPKTLGAAHASRLVSFVAWTLRVLRILLYPALYLTRMLTRLIKKPKDGGISRGEVQAMLTTATEKGLIRPDEARIVKNALRLEQVPVEDVMTPRTVLVRVNASALAATLHTDGASTPYSRLPLYDGGEEDLVGYVRVQDVLRETTADDTETPLRTFLRPLRTFETTTTVGDALRSLVQDGEHIAQVRDPFGGVAGIVTLEDLLETLLGSEILDESDQVADLRAHAVELRNRRLGRSRPSPGTPDAAPDAVPGGE